ncbi:MAG: hypothetical protein K6T66_07495 [Peptococcaceae bacterium]|nr:hypothetical protein [Peptococcaceae bacterium]
MEKTPFQQSIYEYQQGLSDNVLNRIIQNVEINFLEHGTRYQKQIIESGDLYYDEVLDIPVTKDKVIGKKVYIELPEPEMYIAYRIRAFREKIARQHQSLRAEVKDEKEVFDEIFNQIKDFYNIETYDQLYEIKSDLEHFFKNTPYTVEKFFKLKKVIDDVEARIEEEKNNTRKKIMDIFIPILKNALMLVDTNRTDKEIVKYINRILVSEWVNIQLKRNGKKRLQRNNRRDIHIVYPIWSNPLYMIIRRSDIPKSRLEEYLTPKQFELIKKILKIIEKDIAENKIDNYKLNSIGLTELNKRYIAHKLGMDESNLKHKLLRIIQRVNQMEEKRIIIELEQMKFDNSKVEKAIRQSREEFEQEQQRENKRNQEMMHYLMSKKRHTFTNSLVIL